MTEVTAMNDPLTLNTPRWLNTIVSTAAEAVLLVVTIGIITAMWIPAYLNSRTQSANSAEHAHDEMFNMFPRGR
jgi:hypothetical protein